MALTTVPRWDKYDPYIGNFRGTLAADIDLATQANQVLAVGLNSDGQVVIGAGTSGIKGVMIVPVGKDMHGVLLDGGTNIEAGDICDVGKHGEITSFVPSVLTYTQTLTISATGGTFTATLGSNTTSALAFDISAANLKTALAGLDDGYAATAFTVTGSNGGPFSITYPKAYGALTTDPASLTGGSGTATVAQPATTAVAGTTYYGHADGSVNAISTNGVYIGHTVEADRLIVNVLDATS